MKGECGTCEFWQAGISARGQIRECRRYPPNAPAVLREGEWTPGDFPLTTATSGCGEFRPIFKVAKHFSSSNPDCGGGPIQSAIERLAEEVTARDAKARHDTSDSSAFGNPIPPFDPIPRYSIRYDRWLCPNTLKPCGRKSAPDSMGCSRERECVKS